MHYVDAFVVPVPKKKLGEYKQMAVKMSKLCRKYGALKYVEAVADDVQMGKVTSFPRSVKRKPSETVVFAYVVYKSRAHRDSVNAKVMKDPVCKDMCESPMPFDGMRMFWGGFKTIVEA